MLIAALLLAAAPDAAALRTMAARFAPTDVSADLSRLPGSEKAALAKIVEAASLMDTVYLRQAWAGNEPLLLQLAQAASPLGQVRVHLFTLQKGPWSTLDHEFPFTPGVRARPDGANFYPPGTTKEEIEAWHKTLAPKER